MATGAPLLSISVRSRDAGGSVANARTEPMHVIRDRDSLTLLIHGFAVTKKAAIKAYDTFRCGLRPWDRRAVNVYWPGDYGLFGITQASYPIQRRRALDSVTRLQRYVSAELNERLNAAYAQGRYPTPLELRIVAHSLGCLVALELVKLLDRSDKELKITLLVLMAAAVPQYRLNEDDLGYIVRAIPKVRVYRSYSDWVLALAFSAGELPHRPFTEGWRRRSAIGRNGCGGRFDNVVEEERYCGHSGYWPDTTIAAAVREDQNETAYRFLVRRQDPRILVGRKAPGRSVGDNL